MRANSSTTFNDEVRSINNSSITCKKKLLENDFIFQQLNQAVIKISESLENNKKILFCGNGGSAADAQHLAAELSGRFYMDRKSLNSEALHTNTSYLTAVSNDYSFDEIYSRLIEGRGNEGDVLVSLSTSGKSKNVIKAIEVARNLGMFNIGLTGESGGLMTGICDILIKIPSNETPRIQESHILIGHIICEMVEKRLFGQGF